MGRASQPQVQTSAPGYAFAWASSLAYETMIGSRPSVVGTGPTAVIDNYNGQVIRKASFSGAATTAGNLLCGTPREVADIFFNSGGGTGHFLVRPKSTTLQALIGKDDNNINSGWLITGSNVFTFNVVNTGSDSGLPWLTGVTLNAWVLLSITTNGNSAVGSANAQLYTNGRPDNGTFIPGSGTSNTDAANPLTIGGTSVGSYNFGATIDANADIALVALIRRQQTPAQVREFARNPWAIFRTLPPNYADAVAGIPARKYGLRLAGVGLIPFTPPANVVYEA